VPLRYGIDEIPPVTRVRTTALHGAIRALEGRSLLPKYTEGLPGSYRTRLLTVLPGGWLEIPYAIAHYAAIDALKLPVSEQVAIGTAAAGSAQPYVTGALLRMSREMGVTPWTVIAHSHRLWDRMCVGGDISLDRVGPKEAIVTLYGLPYARSQFFRVAIRVAFQEGLLHWCRKGYVTEIGCSNTTVTLREAWA